MQTRYLAFGSVIAIGIGGALWSRADEAPGFPAPTATAVTPAIHPPAPVATATRRPDRARVLYGPPSRPRLLAIPKATVARGAGHPTLEAALEAEGEDPTWTEQVHHDVSLALALDPEIRVDDVQCAQTFCRVRMTKPVASELDWPDIDRLLAPVARGEAIFTATPDGEMTTGYLYFSADDTGLPVDSVRPEPQQAS